MGGASFLFDHMADKRNKHQKRRDASRDENGKTLYERIMSGEQEPEGQQKGWKNLQPIPFNQMEPERRREICRKGAAAVNEIRGEKKSAKQVLENLLTLKATDEIIEGADLTPELIERLKKSASGATLYDVMGAVALGRALGGNIKAAEYIRDTYGDKPIERVEVTENVTTAADRELMQKIMERLESPDVIIAADQKNNDSDI